MGRISPWPWVLLTALVVAAAPAPAHRPPQDLRYVDGHWTAWNPPTSFPEGAEIYRVVRGDTLWDLAGRFYGNPYLWPQIWEHNPYVLDAHWIYPGDPLVVGIEVTPIEEVLAAAEESMEDADAGLKLGSAGGPPVPLGTETDISCSGFIGAPDEKFERFIVGSEYQSLAPTLKPAAGIHLTGRYGDVDTVKLELSTGDIVYVDGGRAANLYPGMDFTIVSPAETVEHPIRRRPLGRFYAFDGRLRILSVQETTAIAEIVHSCLPIHVGAALLPYEPQPVPLARRTPQVGVNNPVAVEHLRDAPIIVRSEARVVSIGQDHLVYLDRGSDSVTPGDLFTIYRLNAEGLPPVVIGEVGVLLVHERSSVAKVLESRYTVHVGDRLDLKSR